MTLREPLRQLGELFSMTNDTYQTIRYLAGVASLTTLGLACLIIDGDIGNAMAVAVAGAVGYLVKDWRTRDAT